MSMRPNIALSVRQNPYLMPGADEMHAVLTVTSKSASGPRGAPSAAEVIIVDTSASMHRPSKLTAVKRATAAAIDALHTGAAFAIVAGSNTATKIYPRRPGLAVAGGRTRVEAKQVMAAVTAGGGTAISTWLRLADELLADREEWLRHAVLLTDGCNTGEHPDKLAETLRSVAGRFSCDCRGIGTDWNVAELRAIATALLGTVDIVAQPADLESDFRAITTAAMAKVVGDVALRLSTPARARVRYVKQVSPSLADLTPHGVRQGPASVDFPTGSWGSEFRDYHVCIDVEPADVGTRMLAARAAMVAPAGAGATEVLAGAKILAAWSDDPKRFATIPPAVVHYAVQADLSGMIQAGLQAKATGDLATATAKLGRAVALAAKSGHAETARLLANVVEVDDAKSGAVRLRTDLDVVDEMRLDTRSTVTRPARHPPVVLG